MAAILTKAGSFLFLILLGYLLKSLGVFSKNDGQVLAKVLVNVTVPAAVITNFQGISLSRDLAGALAVGFVINFSMLLLAWLHGRKKSPDDAVLCVLNGCTFNLGTFALPFLQAFFSGTAIVVACVFDISSAVLCFGACYAVACAVSGRGSGGGVGALVRTLLCSPPFMTYVLLLATAPFQLQLPAPILEMTGMIGAANTPIAMLMLGMMLEANGLAGRGKLVTRILLLRYVFSIVAALGVYFLLPLPHLFRQTLAIVVFSPISCLAPVYTAQCDVDPAPSAIMNSITIPLSLVSMTVVLILTSL